MSWEVGLGVPLSYVYLSVNLDRRRLRCTIYSAMCRARIVVYVYKLSPLNMNTQSSYSHEERVSISGLLVATSALPERVGAR